MMFSHILDELLRGRPTGRQLDTYRSLREAWYDLGANCHPCPDVEAVVAADARLHNLNLKQASDRRHLAEAVALAQSFAKRGDTVLMSPAAASFGIFVNEFDRGDQFCSAVKSI